MLVAQSVQLRKRPATGRRLKPDATRWLERKTRRSTVSFRCKRAITVKGCPSPFRLGGLWLRL
jgi:hypothetical protein